MLASPPVILMGVLWRALMRPILKLIVDIKTMQKLKKMSFWWSLTRLSIFAKMVFIINKSGLSP